MPTTVDKNLCIGCGACASICPDAFKINEEGKSEVVRQENSGCAKNAAESCPVQAIKVE
ncbi:ferredoxin [Patescibacteria group bacterium]|nr:ferredoxin [Patescibacteria group bacterium]MBU4347415.1 ferredoxin [Patescibacteria group bacterium]MBU4455514.1 ferredoxin [Patescibacteria group bacterium]